MGVRKTDPLRRGLRHVFHWHNSPAPGAVRKTDPLRRGLRLAAFADYNIPNIKALEKLTR